MLVQFRNSFFAKVLVCYIAFTLLFPVFIFEARSNTGGNGSAEFSPAAFGNMVDPFSGDFTYSIPLMEVPGPGGSYPIILGYSSSSVNSEADAGWVGMGWNLNIGSVTREMKGLPDDFRGEEITKEYNMKESRHVAFNAGGNLLAEIFGYDLDMPVNVQLYHNTYTGFGFGFGTSLASAQLSHINGKKQQFSVVGSLNLNYDSQKGFGYNVNYGLQSNFLNIMKSQTVDMRQGSMNSSMSGAFMGIVGFGKSLNKTNYIPGESLPIAYGGNTFAAQIGLEAAGNHTPLNVALSRSSQKLLTKSETFPAAGYLYLDYGRSQIKCLMDYNRENDMPVNEENRTLGVPVLQADEYFASGNDFNISFRSFRNDAGILKPETRSSVFAVNSDEIEVDPPNPTQYKAGYNDVTILNSVYSGPWQGLSAGFLSHLNYKPEEASPASASLTHIQLEEPVYFKSKDDLSRSNQEYINAYGGYTASNFMLSYISGEPGVSNILFPTAAGAAQYSSKRVTRETFIKHEKISEIDLNQLDNNNFYVWDDTTAGGNPVGVESDEKFVYDYPAHPHHIGRFKITSSDGVEYDYGLPVYNHQHVEAYYATNQQGNLYQNPATVSVDTDEASTDNAAGADNVFYKTSLPEYTTNHLLTGIRGHDYVDLKNDGITDDDLGYFMKFNYTKYYDNFRWRTPYKGSFYQSGAYSNATDDKAAYYYGTKDVYYINSVESKSHIAVFVLKNRRDGCEPTEGTGDHEHNDDNAGSGNRRLRYLDKIVLYNKNNPDQPLQTVDFDYDYSLYNNTPSNHSASGKLTLKSVKITFLQNNKGITTPYEFTYNTTNDYADLGNDRWGVPQVSSSSFDNLQNTFQFQGDYNKDGVVNATDKTNLNTNVARGLLSGITLPSKGAMNIYYESDDYGYVQDQRAQQLVRILGTSSVTEEEAEIEGHIKKEDLRIYFQLPEPIVDAGSDGTVTSTENNQVAAYIENLKQVYFKAFLELRKPDESDDIAYDYVKGYAEIETDNGYGVDEGSLSSGHFTTGYITLKKAEYGAANTDVHPIRKAGWQYLRAERDDLENPPVTGTGSSFSLIGAFVDLISSVPELIGYYNSCAIKGWCPKIQLESFAYGVGTVSPKPSFIRLNAPSYRKTGGGHRVNKITFTDNFGDHPHTMGQVYEYRTVDGKSSGVATSEPMNGSEDNTLASPRFYTADPNTIYKSDMNYVEGPVNESYFPAPMVGYARVVVKNIPYAENIPGTGTPDDVTQNNNGIDVYEFYTCKDFPVFTSYTSLQHAGKNDIDINIPKGYDNYMYNGYSQGFYCELNNMHGKPKAQATYKTGANLAADAPVHKREYKYFTEAGNRIKNTVPVLTGDANYENVNMGEDYEFFIDMMEQKTKSVVSGDQYNLDGVALIPIPTWFPTQVSETNIYRSVATNKIVHKKGILKEIIENNEGEITSTANLYFDHLTGDALLTSVNNSYKAPVYNYNFAGHWYYDGMQPMYNNMHARIFHVDAPTGDVTLARANLFMRNGDRIMVMSNDGTTPAGTILYVHNLDHTGFELADIDNAAPDLDDALLKIVGSGFKNLQSVACGNLESLQNPVTENTNVFLLYNRLVTHIVNDDEYIFNDIKTCNNEGENTNDITTSLQSTGLYFYAQDQCVFIAAFTVRSGASLKDFRFLSNQPGGGQLKIQDLVTGEVVDADCSSYVSNFENCYKPCFTVLNASAAEYHNGDWNYNYADAGAPKIIADVAEEDLDASTGNDYHFGKAGIYRVKKNYAMQVARKQQSGTHIDKDGEYVEYTPFDWIYEGNPDWTWAQELTRVSPYGITLETEDRSGIKASSLSGFNHKTIVAQSANASYFETGYDGFEDYRYDVPGTSYVYDKHGHFNLTYDDTDPVVIDNDRAHTGKLSLALPSGEKIIHPFEAGSGEPTGDYFGAKATQRYLASGWFYAPAHNVVPVIKIKNVTTGTYLTPFVTYDGYPAIEGWKKMEIGFSVSSTTDDYQIEWYLYNTTSSTIVAGYLDDIRVHPFKAAMVSMVYDPLTLWKVAELDNQNFATFYTYDEEGNIVQVKKETINGVVTIGTSRSNINRQ